MTKRIGRNPTRAERKHLRRLGMQSSDWLVVSKHEYVWQVVHRFVGQAKEIRSENWI